MTKQEFQRLLREFGNSSWACGYYDGVDKLDLRDRAKANRGTAYEVLMTLFEKGLLHEKKDEKKD